MKRIYTAHIYTATKKFSVEKSTKKLALKNAMEYLDLFKVDQIIIETPAGKMQLEYIGE